MEAVCRQIVLEPQSRCDKAVSHTYLMGGAAEMDVTASSTVGLTPLYLRLVN